MQQTWRPPLINRGDLSNTGGAGFGTVDAITPGYSDSQAVISALGGSVVPAAQSPFGIPHVDFGNAGVGLIALLGLVVLARSRLL